jgi:hypothetical protein
MATQPLARNTVIGLTFGSSKFNIDPCPEVLLSNIAQSGSSLRSRVRRNCTPRLKLESKAPRSVFNRNGPNRFAEPAGNFLGL